MEKNTDKLSFQVSTG